MTASDDVVPSQRWCGRGVLACPFELRILRKGNYRSLFAKRRPSLPVCLTETLYTSASDPRYDVILLGDAGFRQLLESIQLQIKNNGFMKSFYERRVLRFGELSGDTEQQECKSASDELAVLEKAEEALHSFYKDVSTEWASLERCVLGHVIYSPSVTGTGYQLRYGFVLCIVSGYEFR